ncbi:MAG: hypothetical protein FGM32_08290 [Candidatus Kapabacteria bacterium]|nr:hypothetical protein [Candidatus Kapabacteria bacterium]
MQHQTTHLIRRAKVALSIVTLTLSLSLASVEAKVAPSPLRAAASRTASASDAKATVTTGQRRSASEVRDEVKDLISRGAYDNCTVRPGSNPIAVTEPLTSESEFARTYRTSVFAPSAESPDGVPGSVPALEDVARAFANEMSTSATTRVLIYNKVLQALEVMVARRILRNDNPSTLISYMFTDHDIRTMLTSRMEAASELSSNR